MRHIGTIQLELNTAQLTKHMRLRMLTIKGWTVGSLETPCELAPMKPCLLAYQSCLLAWVLDFYFLIFTVHFEHFLERKDGML